MIKILIYAAAVFFACPAYAQTASTNDSFAFELYAQLSDQKGNLFFSPYSMTSALEMAYEGAQGQTALQMGQVLHLNTNEALRREAKAQTIAQMNSGAKDYQLSVANALWAEKTYELKPPYVAMIKSVYGSEAANLDFIKDPQGARGQINAWVSEKTNHRIEELLPPASITEQTRLVLTNAVYFKGSWKTAFPKERTKPGDFWVDPSHSVSVPMMKIFEGNFQYTENDEVQIVVLPYQGEDLSMVIVLPKKEMPSLNAQKIDAWLSSVHMSPVQVVLPSFKVDAFYKMKGILANMGMKDAFTQKADFSLMSQKGDLYLDEVYHKAWIDVNEEGTEAAAATALVGVPKSIGYSPPKLNLFKADHPFVFMIKDRRTNLILFMGRVSDPSL